MDNRKAPRRTRLSHSATPYSRSTNGANEYHNKGLETPGKGSRDSEVPQTPGSIFSRVISIFTPSRWVSPSRREDDSQEKSENNDESSLQNIDEMTDDINVQTKSKLEEEVRSNSDKLFGNLNLDSKEMNTPTRYLPFLFSPARQSKSPIPNSIVLPQGGIRSSSPNQKLAEFFKKKGDAPLSDIEMEGVMALMRQAYEEQKGFGEIPTKTSVNPDMASSAPITSQLYPTVPSFVTPARHSRQPLISSQVKAPRYNPHFTPQYRRSMTPLVYKPRQVRYPSVSTPFKARYASPAPGAKRARLDSISEPKALFSKSPSTPSVSLSSSVPISSVGNTPTINLQNTSTGTPASNSSSKRLSQTASTLLSLIEPIGTPSEVSATREEDRKLLTDPKLQPFVNPYAAPSPDSRIASPSIRSRGRGETLVGGSTRKRRVIAEIERTMPEEDRKAVTTFAESSPFKLSVATATPSKQQSDASEPRLSPALSSSMPSSAPASTPTAVPTLDNKFKPTKSSGLRESVVASPPSTPLKDSKGTEVIPAPTQFPLGEAQPKAASTSFSFSTGRSNDSGKHISSSELFSSGESPALVASNSSESTLPLSSKPESMSMSQKLITAQTRQPLTVSSGNANRDKALVSEDYKAYMPKFYFVPPAGVKAEDDECKKQAASASDSLLQSYSYSFPSISSESL
ncbi:hypothetical protein V1511DRAFT_455924 [Dipodascopsis uninucleata]